MPQKSNNLNWNIGRDSNINPTSIYGYFLYNPLIDNQERSTGNIAAKKSDMVVNGCLASSGEMSYASKLLLDGHIFWHEYMIHLLSSRGSSSIKPLVAICKFIEQKLNTSKSQYDVTLTKQDILDISTALNYQELSSLPGSGDQTTKPDIWFNALAQTGLFFKPSYNNGNLSTSVAYLIRIPKVEALIRFIASQGDNFGVDFDITTQLGGICSVLEKDFNYEFKELIPNLIKHGHKIDSDFTNFPNFVTNSEQLIYYGPPGTGKSHKLDQKINDTNSKYVYRTTFHPEYDYAQFVGCYKPIETVEDSGKRILSYRFVPQAFMNAYLTAWLHPQEHVFLVIEEINRGNCAEIFGDIFQLLDRCNGISKYPINPSHEIQQYLQQEFKKSKVPLPPMIANGFILQLPPNLSIMGTMNTSDQSLFPMDSAFRRRWQWKYTPISRPKKDENSYFEHTIAIGSAKYNWWDFVNKINKLISNVTESEDKQLGYWFAVSPEVEEINVDDFVSKVLFYLWNDVFKDYGKDCKDSPFVVNDNFITFSELFNPDETCNHDKVKLILDSLDRGPAS